MVGKIIKVIIGLVLIGLGGWTIYMWLPELLILVRGGIGLVLIFAGLITFALVAD